MASQEETTARLDQPDLDLDFATENDIAAELALVFDAYTPTGGNTIEGDVVSDVEYEQYHNELKVTLASGQQYRVRVEAI